MIGSNVNMFLKKLIENNPSLVEFSLKKTNEGEILPDSYVIDFDTLINNAKEIKKEADKYNIKLFFMLKQIGRNPLIAKELMNIGYDGVVCVDYKEALLMIEHGVKIGNVGHLEQIPNCALEKIILSKPELITVYTIDKIKQINEVANKLGLVQGIMIRLTDDDSLLYPGQIAGFSSSELKGLINEVSKLDNVQIKGLTVFPALLFNGDTKRIEATSNVNAINRGKEICEEMGLDDLTINLPSCTCVNSMKLIHELGGNNGEPGHGLSGTTPLHAISNQIEKVAYCYVSEISHNYKNNSYCFGGGSYRRGHLENVLVGESLANALMTKVTLPDSESIDYHFEIKGNHEVGRPCLMSFRTQIFTTRSNVVIVKGLSSGNPSMYLYDALGREIGVNWK